MISKNISYGTIDIDKESGRIWLNCPSCIIRIQNIPFNQISEKFSMIDINRDEINMYPGELPNKEFGNFMEMLTTLIVPKISNLNIEEQKNFLDDLFIKIKKELKNVNIG